MEEGRALTASRSNRDSRRRTRPLSLRFDWNTEPLIHDALKHAVSLLFEEVRPLGKGSLNEAIAAGDVPKYASQMIANSKEHGQWAFWYVWDDILVVSPPSKDQQPTLGLSTDDILWWRRLGFDAVRVRGDLKIGEKRS